MGFFRVCILYNTNINIHSLREIFLITLFSAVNPQTTKQKKTFFFSKIRHRPLSHYCKEGLNLSGPTTKKKLFLGVSSLTFFETQITFDDYYPLILWIRRRRWRRGFSVWVFLFFRYFLQQGWYLWCSHWLKNKVSFRFLVIRYSSLPPLSRLLKNGRKLGNSIERRKINKPAWYLCT